MTDSPESLSRREMIGVTAAALAAPLLNVAAERARSVAGRSDRFLTAEQFALLDELTELIIPADDHSPGARAAEVARYIDGTRPGEWSSAGMISSVSSSSR